MIIINDSIPPCVSPNASQVFGKDMTKNCDEVSTVREAFKMAYVFARHVMSSASKDINLKLAHILLHNFPFLFSILLLVLNPIVKVSNHISTNDCALGMRHQYNLFVTILLHLHVKFVPKQPSRSCTTKHKQSSFTHETLQEVKDRSVCRIMKQFARPAKQFSNLLTHPFCIIDVIHDSITKNPQFFRMIILHFPPIHLLVVIIVFILFIQLIPEPVSVFFGCSPFLFLQKRRVDDGVQNSKHQENQTKETASDGPYGCSDQAFLRFHRCFLHFRHFHLWLRLLWAETRFDKIKRRSGESTYNACKSSTNQVAP
mmetsp:Transcript_21097/g.32168  ORF Transcript_21097/g.32168 Transcript_21097/m.32168 type:complete len:314 (+) Transcript_21097:263-1204(+)